MVVVVMVTCCARWCLCVALVKLSAPRLVRVLSDTTVAVELFPLTSSSHGGHVTHYYVAVVPANLRAASNDVRLDEVPACAFHDDINK